MPEKEKANIIIAILISILSLLVFYALTILFGLIITFIVALLMYIPIVSGLFELFLDLSYTKPEMIVAGAGPLPSAIIVALIINKITKNNSTSNLTSKITGTIIIIHQVAAAIINLIADNSILINFFGIFAGAIIICANKEDWF